MAKGTNQKLKLLYLKRILLEKTDELHGLTLAQIISELEHYGIEAGRKGLYSDIEELRNYGLDIIDVHRDRTVYYHIGQRDFELTELKILVDVVQSSRFITLKKSEQLISKIEKLTSRYEAKSLQGQVSVYGRIKSMNESIYYSVDQIHQAIERNVKIYFRYMKWNVDKKMVDRHEKKIYKISPWKLVWDQEWYYMIGYDDEVDEPRHFRVDKMKNIELTNIGRKGHAFFQSINQTQYKQQLFGMFGGERMTVKLLCDNQLVGVIIDRFGKDVIIHKVDEKQFEVTVDVIVSDQFLGWISSLGEGVKVIAPQKVVDRLVVFAKRLLDEYQNE